jgi:hypothetical protein
MELVDERSDGSDEAPLPPAVTKGEQRIVALHEHLSTFLKVSTLP